MTNTATVTTLTAAVHVMQVGSRQVTLSIARQADRVAPENITPFGRVRLEKRFEVPYDRVIEVVGVDARTGALVRSAVEHGESYTQSSGWSDIVTDNDIHQAWARLPLISLAGLK